MKITMFEDICINTEGTLKIFTNHGVIEINSSVAYELGIFLYRVLDLITPPEIEEVKEDKPIREKRQCNFYVSNELSNHIKGLSVTDKNAFFNNALSWCLDNDIVGNCLSNKPNRYAIQVKSNVLDALIEKNDKPGSITSMVGYCADQYFRHIKPCTDS